MDELKKVRVFADYDLSLNDWRCFFRRDPSSVEELKWFLEHLCDYSTIMSIVDILMIDDWESYLKKHCEFTEDRSDG